jgi:signal peptidase II
VSQRTPYLSMNRFLRPLLVLGVLAACVSCDQASKRIAEASLGTSPPRFLLHGAVELQLVENRGAFLSLGETLPPGTRSLLFVVLVSGALLAMISFALSSRSVTPRHVLALSLLAGGGAGNLLDRLLRHGAVVDFVSLGIGPLHTGVFNLADTAITTGIVLLVLTLGWPAESPVATEVASSQS